MTNTILERVPKPMFGVDGPEFYFGDVVDQKEYVSFIQSVQSDADSWKMPVRISADEGLKESRLEVELGHGWGTVSRQTPAITDPFGENTYRIMRDKWLGIQMWVAKDATK